MANEEGVNMMEMVGQGRAMSSSQTVCLTYLERHARQEEKKGLW